MGGARGAIRNPLHGRDQSCRIRRPRERTRDSGVTILESTHWPDVKHYRPDCRPADEHSSQSTRQSTVRSGLSKGHRNREPGVCVYCGREDLVTQDHIPPKALYPAAIWPRLLKIPSCAQCNNGASKDDEYLRTIIGLSAKGERDETLKPISDATVRALSRPEAAGFRHSILRDLQRTFISDANGVLVPVFVGNVDLSRLDRVVARIIKGIFFFERGVRLPEGYEVVNYSVEGLKSVPTPVGRQLQAALERVMAGDPKLIGGPQFAYWSVYDERDPNQSGWLCVIHRHHFFIGWTSPA